MTALGVQNFLDISTGNLVLETDGPLLNRLANERTLICRGPRVIWHEYGWWVNVVSDDFDSTLDDCRELGLSDGFISAYQYARDHKCWWINFDSDAEIIDTK